MKAPWNPDVDAAARALEPPREWMSQEDFADVWRRYFHRARTAPGVEIIGINAPVAKRIITGERPIRKVEALSVYHFLMGWRPPPLVDEPESFRIWFEGVFGDAQNPVGDWLELSSQARILDYMRGHTVIMGRTFDRRPGVALVRALDWVRRVGPIVPTTGDYL